MRQVLPYVRCSCCVGLGHVVVVAMSLLTDISLAMCALVFACVCAVAQEHFRASVTSSPPFVAAELFLALAMAKTTPGGAMKASNLLIALFLKPQASHTCHDRRRVKVFGLGNKSGRPACAVCWYRCWTACCSLGQALGGPSLAARTAPDQVHLQRLGPCLVVTPLLGPHG